MPNESDLFDGAHESPKAILQRCTSESQLADTAVVKNATPKLGKKLGTYMGVFFPCMQNIVGIILFLRLTWITAQAGTIGATLILLASIGSTILTTLSLSAICTNGKIPGGGPYYVISRNLGIEVGASIGIMYYLGTTFAASMYCLGAAEAFQATFNLEGGSSWELKIQGIVLAIILAGIVFIGVKYVNMASSLFLVVVFASIASAFLGLVLLYAGVDNDRIADQNVVAFDNMLADFEPDNATGILPSYSTLLALLYPSVTGCLAGTNRSGVLKNPAISIPHGTLSAIFWSSILYVMFIWGFGSTFSNELLKNDKLIVSSISWPYPRIVNFGIMFSSIGAGLQSFVGAPRILTAIAKDDAIPILRHFEVREDQEPRAAVILTCVIAALPCFAGNLDFISPLVTMFMLMMYLSVNMACFVLGVLKTPSFRPTWKFFHWSTALAGMVWCISLMVIISWYQAFIALTLAALLWMYVSYQGATKDWGSAVRGLKFQVASKALLSLQSKDGSLHAKNWCPQLLVLSKVDAAGKPLRNSLLNFASQLKKGRGLVDVVSFIEGGLGSMDTARNMTTILQKHIEKHQFQFFGRVHCTSSITSGILVAIQASGIGQLKSNTVLMGWPRSWRDIPNSAENFVSNVNGSIAARKSLMVLRSNDAEFPTSEAQLRGNIDVWWILHDGGLLMLIPHLLRLHKVWQKCEIRLFTVANENENSIEIKRRLERYMVDLRIVAKIFVVEMTTSDISNIVSQRTLDMVAGRHLIKKIMSNSMTTRVQVDEPQQKNSMLLQLFESLPDAKEESIALNDVEVSTDAAIALQGWKQPTKGSSPRDTALEPIDSLRMEHAVRLHQRILEHSAKSQLVIMNLPRAKGVVPTDFMEYVEVIIDELPHVVLMRGSGQEVVTTFG